MQFTRKKTKWLGLAVVLAVAVGGLLFFGLNKPMTASAYESHPTGTRAVYDGYAEAPSGNWYNDSLPVSSAPMITVLTHGLGGSPRNWSNDYNGSSTNIGFSYDNRSLIEQLRSNAPNGAIVFWAEMMSTTTFRLMELPVLGQLTRYSTTLPTISRIDASDIAKHIVIVFDAWAPDASNNAVYGEFSTMLNRIVRDVAHLTGGLYPKINLIGIVAADLQICSTHLISRV